MINLAVLRLKQGPNYTRGMLVQGLDYDAFNFLCDTLEDVHRDVKVPGETRIPAGVYELRLRAEGGKYKKYLDRFGEWQRPGMLHVTNVPGFEWILIHPGNTPKDTEGCLLVGDGYDAGAVMQSVAAYERIYKHIVEYMNNGERVWITYVDADR